MKKRRKVPLLTQLVTAAAAAVLLLVLPPVTTVLAGVEAASACVLNRVAKPAADVVDVRVAFSDTGGGGGGGRDPEPMQTRRFLAEREYTIEARSLNPRLGLVRFALGLLPHSGGGGGGGGGSGSGRSSPNVGRLLPPPPALEASQRASRDQRCDAFYCHTGCQPRPVLRFSWSAPADDGAACVEIRALATLEFDDTSWLRASAFLCRALPQGAAVRRLPAAPCCACGSANYVMRFHGAWDPAEAAKRSAESEALEQLQEQRLSWSELLGTSHDDTYAPWELGGYSTAGVRKLCESGLAGLLEDEIRVYGASSVLTVIKARDLPSGARGGDQTRSAIFTVNATHHLVTFLSRPVPSPDWCVGLSLLDMCQANCTWVERLTLPLHLWDAGTDAGRWFFPAGKRQPESPGLRIAYVDAATVGGGGGGGGGRPMASVSLERIPPRRQTDDDSRAACANFTGLG